MVCKASSTALRNSCVSAALVAIAPKTDSMSIALGVIVSASACLVEVVVRITPEVAESAVRRRAAAHEDFAPAGVADAALLEDGACVEGCAADLAAIRASSNSRYVRAMSNLDCLSSLRQDSFGMLGGLREPCKGFLNSRFP